MKSIRWQHFLTRETVLLERWLRMQSYAQMSGLMSRMRLRSMLVLSRDGLTAVYVDPKEKRRQLNVAAKDFFGREKEFFRAWGTAVKGLEEATLAFKSRPSLERWRAYVAAYQEGRAIVFYVEKVLALLEQQNVSLKKLKPFIHWHEVAEKATSFAWDKLQSSLTMIARSSGHTLDELLRVTPEEFEQLLTRRSAWPTARTLRQRKTVYILLMEKSRIRLIVGDAAKKLESRVVNKITKNVKEIKGASAQSGTIQGVVRIVNTAKQMGAMKKGEVLVSVMTTPRLLLAMKKASAIVTDEGGMTCHAAVVARELKIPCVVGTKNATKVFKDGDRVEVDATKGIVRKI